MADKTSELEERVRGRAYFLWEREGRPEGRADEHWRRAAELEAAEAVPEGEGGRHTDNVGEGVEAAPGAERAPSGGTSRRSAEPVDRSARSGAAQRQQAPRQRSQAAPRGSGRKGAAAEVITRAPMEAAEKGSRPPPR